MVLSRSRMVQSQNNTLFRWRHSLRRKAMWLCRIATLPGGKSGPLHDEASLFERKHWSRRNKSCLRAKGAHPFFCFFYRLCVVLSWRRLMHTLFHSKRDRLRRIPNELRNEDNWHRRINASGGRIFALIIDQGITGAGSTLPSPKG